MGALAQSFKWLKRMMGRGATRLKKRLLQGTIFPIRGYNNSESIGAAGRVALPREEAIAEVTSSLSSTSMLGVRCSPPPLPQ